MKKYCLVTFLFAVLVSMPMFAYDFVQNGIYYNIEDDHVSVTYSGNGVYSGSVSIPSQVTYGGVTYPVTAIGEWAFEGGEGMTSLTIPSSITSIGEYAFIDCGSNINVYINDLKAWCKVTFGNVHSSPLSSAKSFYSGGSVVTSLIIPDGVESIPNFAFYQCRSITFLNIPSSVKSIGSSAFEDCTGLKSAYLTEGVESIGGSSFEGCTNLSTIILPSSLTSIAINAFRNCTSLNTIASWIENPFALDESAFSTYSTATLIVPEGATAAYQLTDGWNLFTKITDDPSKDPTVRTIHVATAGTLSDYISDSKYLITDLTLTGELNGTDFGFLREMAGKTILGMYGRYRSTGGLLRVLDISNLNIKAGGDYYKLWGATDYDESDFYYLEKDNTLSEVFEDCTNLTTIILPNNLTSIGSSTFKGCSNLTSITIPNSVTSIDHSAFENTGWYNNQANGLLYLDKWLLGYKGNKPVGELKIIEGTKGIAGSAFYGCSGLTSVTIPNSVTSIGGSAFYNCNGLTTIVSEIENPFAIGNNLFYSSGKDIYATATLIVPEGKRTVYQSTEGWKKFTNIIEVGEGGIIGQIIKVDGAKYKICENNTMSVTRSVGGVSKPNENYLGDLVIHDYIVFNGVKYTVTSIESDAFCLNMGVKSLTSIMIPSTITSIGDDAFGDQYDGFEAVYITDLEAWCNIQFGGDWSNPLRGAHHLYLNGEEIKDLVIPDGVTSIGSKAFYGCSGLTSVTIPNSVTSIGNYAFSECNGLTSVIIGNSVTSIGNYAFRNCSGLTSIKVESGNEKYDSRNNCNAIIETSTNTLIAGCQNTTIPNSVTSIGSSAFYGCSGLTSVTIPNSVTSIGNYAFRDCSGLISVTIPNSVTSIGNSAFSGCSGLTSIVSLNSNPPSLQDSYTFYNVDKNNCVVWVPKGSLSAYKGANGWKDFANIFELVEGDLNLDDVVDQNDMDALVGFVMGKNPEGFYEGLADLNGDNKINAADVVKMVDLVRASSGLGTVSQFVIENSVVSSLTCTLNNERSEAIQLTKCELYCNHNLVSYESFLGASASVAAGGSKQCTFNNLAKLNSSTGFTVCWYYTANGKNYVYRCPLKE